MRPGRRRCSEFSGFALRLRCSRMPALPQTDTLLLDVHEFVRQTRRTFCGVGCETTSAEEDVRADCKGVGMSVGRQSRCIVVRVHANIGKARTQPRLHGTAQRRRQRLMVGLAAWTASAASAPPGQRRHKGLAY